MTVWKHSRENGGRRRAGAPARPWEETEPEAAGSLRRYTGGRPRAFRGPSAASPRTGLGEDGSEPFPRNKQSVPALPAPAYRDGGSGTRVTAKVTKGHSRFSVISVPAVNIKQKQ